MTIRSKVFPKVLDKYNGPLGNTIPANAKVYYNFGSLDPAYAILEQYGRASSLSTTRADDSNVIQLNGSTATYGANNAALSGGGVLVQSAATNDYASPTSFESASWVKGGTTAVDNSLSENGYSYSLITDDNATGRHLLVSTGSQVTTTANEVMTSYFIVRKGTSQYVAVSNRITASSVILTKVIDLNTGLETDEDQTGVVSNKNLIVKRLYGDTFLISLTCSFAAGATSWQGVLALSDSATPSYTSSGEPTYTGTTSLSMYCVHAQVTHEGSPSSQIFAGDDTRALDLSTILTSEFLSTDFSITIPFEFRGSDATDGRIAVSGTDFDLHYDDANTRYELITALGTVVSGTITPSYGDEITLIASINSTTGGTLTLNGSTGTANAAVTSITWSASTMRYMNNLAGTAATNALINTTLLK